MCNIISDYPPYDAQVIPQSITAAPRSSTDVLHNTQFSPAWFLTSFAACFHVIKVSGLWPRAWTSLAQIVSAQVVDVHIGEQAETSQSKMAWPSIATLPAMMSGRGPLANNWPKQGWPIIAYSPKKLLRWSTSQNSPRLEYEAASQHLSVCQNVLSWQPKQV